VLHAAHLGQARAAARSDPADRISHPAQQASQRCFVADSSIAGRQQHRAVKDPLRFQRAKGCAQFAQLRAHSG
jgi:hypothetical protein